MFDLTPLREIGHDILDAKGKMAILFLFALFQSSVVNSISLFLLLNVLLIKNITVVTC